MSLKGIKDKFFSVGYEGKRKVITIFGIKIKYKEVPDKLIVKFIGGLGNQMFQYGFGKSLEKITRKKVLFYKHHPEYYQRFIVNENGENAKGAMVRQYALDIFDLNITFATDRQYKSCEMKFNVGNNPFDFNPELFKKQKSALYIGYFQNEKYLNPVRKQLEKDLTFPKIKKDDTFNQNWLKKIRSCENPVFIHIRKGDYVNLGWDLSMEYYTKAIKYIKEHVENPTFFVFGQKCSDFIKNEFISDIPFEIIGETNSDNKEDWKDIVLMEECKHAIIANSTFSWWAAWLGKANNGIVTAPSPFLFKRDEIICSHWVKIKWQQ